MLIVIDEKVGYSKEYFETILYTYLINQLHIIYYNEKRKEPMVQLLYKDGYVRTPLNMQYDKHNYNVSATGFLKIILPFYIFPIKCSRRLKKQTGYFDIGALCDLPFLEIKITMPYTEVMYEKMIILASVNGTNRKFNTVLDVKKLYKCEFNTDLLVILQNEYNEAVIVELYNWFLYRYKKHKKCKYIIIDPTNKVKGIISNIKKQNSKTLILKFYSLFNINLPKISISTVKIIK